MRANILFFIIFVLLGGCASVPPPRPAAPVPPQASPAPPATPAQAVEPAQQKLAKPPEVDALFQALAMLGVDYRRGGGSPASGFDCSGLVAYVYREAFGIELPHYTLAQSKHGRSVGGSALQMGDLVFYNTERQPYSHVGIYLGDGRFVHAPRPGASVRIEKMTSSYWAKRFDGARRILSN